MDQTEYFELCDILHVNFGYMPNNSCNKINITNKIIFLNQAFDMNKQTTFFLGGGGGGGGGQGSISPFLHARYLERTYFQPSFIIILLYTSCLLFPWNLNILYNIYHLIHFVTYFLFSFGMQYEEPFLITL